MKEYILVCDKQTKNCDRYQILDGDKPDRPIGSIYMPKGQLPPESVTFKVQ